jgi:hypothetical protein
MTRTPTPTAPSCRCITEHLIGDTADGRDAIGTFSLRLVLTTPGQTTDPGAWAITHPLGSVAGGTHTEVVFVDGTLGRRDTLGDGSFVDPERDRLADEVVRQIASIVYGPGRWAFHYRPERVADAVLRHGSSLRERVEVSSVEVWA